MPEYHYVAVDVTGRKVEAQMDVPHEDELRMYLRAQGLRPLRIKKKVFPSLLQRFFLAPVPPEQPKDFFVQLEALYRAGVPLTSATDLLAQKLRTSYFKQILNKTTQQLRSGKKLYESLAIYPKIFDSALIALIEKEETQGRVDQALAHVNDYLAPFDRFKIFQRSRVGLRIEMGLLGIGVFILLTVYIYASQFFHLLNYQAAGFTVAVLVILLLTQEGYLKTISGRIWFERMLFKLPILGLALRSVAFFKICHAWSCLMKAGYTFKESLERSRFVTNILYVEYLIREMKIAVEQGRPASAVLVKYSFVPKVMIQALGLAESQNSLEAQGVVVFESMANYFKAEYQQVLQKCYQVFAIFFVIALWSIFKS